MTREQAIKRLKWFDEYNEENYCGGDRIEIDGDWYYLVNKDDLAAFEMAIASLETDEAYQLEYERTAKKDLAVDCISRDEVKYYIQAYIHEIITESGIDKNAHTNGVLRALLNEVDIMPPVTPQLSSGFEKNSQKLENASPIIDWNNCHTSEQIDNIATTKNDLVVDCVSRQSVLDKIQRLINAEQNNIDENGDYMNYARERVNAYEAIQFFVENDCLCPSVTPQEPRWIPVSERLPEKNMRCLVAVGRFNFTEIATYSDLMGIIDHKIFYQGDVGHDNFKNITQYVKAWMPLLKSYKAESENKG